MNKGFFNTKLAFVLIVLLFSFVFASSVSAYDLTTVPLVCGDASGDGQVNIGDAVYLISYIFRDGPVPVPIGVADVDSSGFVDVGDVVYLINYIFRDGPAPVCLPLWPIIFQPDYNASVSNPIHVSVENQGLADFSEVTAVKLYYAVDSIDWIYLQTAGPSTENLWEFDAELEPGPKYIMVIMESATAVRTSPAVLLQVN